MPLNGNNAAIAQQVYDNLYRILLMLTQAVGNPTAANIDEIVQIYTGASVNQYIVKPQVSGTTSEGKPTYDWTGYMTAVIGQMKTMKQLVIIEQGYFEVRLHAY